jgi:predicted transcriptional regulator
MTDRREMGSLEHEVMSELWALGEPATPAAVRDAMGTDLAYTTVMTILTRLWQKGLVTRRRSGRAYAYTPSLTEADLTAQRMRATLATASDPKAALSRFVGSLSTREARTLRALLDGSDRRPRS